MRERSFQSSCLAKHKRETQNGYKVHEWFPREILSRADIYKKNVTKRQRKFFYNGYFYH